MANAMRKVSLRNLAAHKLRLALTVLSVVLGTAFVAGSLIFTATIGNSFNSLFDHVAVGVDVQISPKSAESASGTLGVPDSILTTLESQKSALGIDKIVPSYNSNAVVADSTGKAIQTGGAPSLAANWYPDNERLDPDLKILPGGHAPQAPDQVVMNESAAKKAGLQVGSHTRVVISNGSATPLNVTVVGLVQMPGATSGYTEVDFDNATAKKLLTDGHHSAAIQLKARDGVTADQLKQRVQPLAADYKVQTGTELRKDYKAQLNSFLQVFNYILLAFAAIGLIVGTFIIYNTFSMIVAQRVRELALLRAIGTSRRQVTRSVLMEALVVGLIGAVVGFIIGVGLAVGLRALLSASGSGLPGGPLVISPMSIIACLVVGVVVTMLSAYAPARRASKVAPVEAMRESQTDGAASLRSRTIVGVVLAIAGAVLVVLGAMGKGGSAALSVGAGALLLIFAIVLAAPALSQPVIAVFGSVLGRPFGKIGRLARTNAVRNPRRTAATAFALTLGLMLVAVIGTLGSSFKATIDKAVSSDLTANYILMATGGQSVMPSSVASRAASVDGVQQVVSWYNVPASIKGQTDYGTATSGDLRSVFKLTAISGSMDLSPTGMLVSDKEAAAKGWTIGSPVTLNSKVGGRSANLHVTGIFKESTMSGPYFVAKSVYDTLTPTQLQSASVVLVKLDSGADSKAVQNRIEDSIKDYLTVQVQTPKQFANSRASTIDQMLVVLYGMLALSLLIAVLGIVNTLALSVIERKREIGMLRAVGMQRKQVRRTIYLESVLISIFGALLGMVVGVAIGWCLVRTFREWIPGISPEIPWGTILITLVLAVVVGVLAALWPAVRAARTRPLEAISDV